jgi:hypothetical protein
LSSNDFREEENGEKGSFRNSIRHALIPLRPILGKSGAR